MRNMAPFWASEISSSRSRFRLPVVFIRTNLAGRLRSPARSASQIRRLAFLTSRGANQRGHRDGQLFRQFNSDTQSVAPSTSSFSVSRSTSIVHLVTIEGGNSMRVRPSSFLMTRW